jgi:hypothetical protein
MAPDYRSDKMGSIEGVSNARGRWFDWLSELSDDEAAFLMRMPNITVFTNLDRTRRQGRRRRAGRCEGTF